MRISVTPVAFSAHPAFGPDHVFSRLEAGCAGGLPVFAPGDRLPAADCYVVGGQQPMLLGGPIFTLLKAATVVALAEDLTERWSSPVKPLFWIASEDHDVLEVNRLKVGGKKLVCPYSGSLRRGEVPPVGAISLCEHKERILRFLQENLPEGRWREWVLERIEALDFSNYATQFEGLLRLLCGPLGLLTIRPEAIRERQAPILARVLRRWRAVVSAFERGSERLRAVGFEPPLARVTLFELVKGRRRAVEVENGTVLFAGRRLQLADAASALEEEPHRFSPGAALRPIIQDGVLNVAATVAGPTELLYLWQIRDMYEVLEVKPSLPAPRISATLLESAAVKKLRQLSIPLQEAFCVPERLRVWESREREAEGPELREIASRAQELVEAVKRVETPANRKYVARALRTIGSTVEKLIDKLRRDEREARDLAGGRLRALCEVLLPGGKAQERSASAIEFLTRWGPDLVRVLCEDLDPWARYHQLAVIQSDEEALQ